MTDRPSKIRLAIKRLFDFFFSLILLCILSPLMLILTAVLSITMNGKPFFVQKRVGKNGKSFKIYKFRTLTDKAPANASLTEEDLTKYESKFGKILRKYGLDEIPQLFNVLKGDMSIIGYRPLIPSDDCNMLRGFLQINFMRPGITGLAQIHGGNDMETYDKLAYDQHYVNHWSLREDAEIFFKTIYWVVAGRHH